jgi:bifunctional ADP-heptose synthase (sugar kinase/adenylyltransferase)
VVLIPVEEGKSTTNIIAKILGKPLSKKK